MLTVAYGKRREVLVNPELVLDAGRSEKAPVTTWIP